MAIGDNFEDSESYETTVSEDTDISTEESIGSDEEEAENSCEEIIWRDLGVENLTYSHEAFTFKGPSPGPTIPVTSISGIIERLIPEEVITIIVRETNYFIENKEQRSGNKNNKHQELLTKDELWVFIAVFMLTEIHGKNNIAENWSTDELLHTPIFSRVMSRNRFQYISQSLQFCSERDENSKDKIWKIRNIFDLFNNAFKALYNIQREIVIDENLLLWKGHPALARYIPTKADRWGFKFFCLGEAKTGYIHSMYVDQGSNSQIKEDMYSKLQMPGKMVMKIMQPILGKGYFLGLDHFYTDIPLFNLLHRNHTDVIGTLCSNRHNIPLEIKKKQWKKSDRGKMNVQHSEDFIIMKWMDEREVRIISSVGSACIKPEFQNKPKIVALYHLLMPGVELADQIRHPQQIARGRMNSWDKKFFFQLLDVAIVNSYIISKHVPNLPFATHESFRLDVIQSILRKHQQLPRSNNSAQQITRNIVTARTCSLFDIRKVNNRRRRACKVCKKKTSYFCFDCQQFLCVIPCYKIFHTVASQADIVD